MTTLLMTLFLTGCHTLRVGSPQIQRAPEIRCIVVVETDRISAEIVGLALNACEDAIDQKQPAIKEPAKP
jgi:hypothetical protein